MIYLIASAAFLGIFGMGVVTYAVAAPKGWRDFWDYYRWVLVMCGGVVMTVAATCIIATELAKAVTP